MAGGLREMVVERARDKVRQVLRWGGLNGGSQADGEGSAGWVPGPRVGSPASWSSRPR